MEQENMEPEIVDPEIMEGEIVEEDKDPTLQFIEAVKEHKCIWDMQSEEYYNKKMYRAAWKSLVQIADDLMSERPDITQQKAEIKEKVAELKNVWVELRDSYFKNEHPGKKYKDSLRFLHSVYQSREIEAVLEFDEPSWNLMDVRTWTVLKKHIPRCKRSTDPAPEYEKAKYNKKPKTSTNVAKKPGKDNLAGKKNTTGKGNAAGKENAAVTENATSKDNVTAKEKATDKDNLIGPANVTDKENATCKVNATNEENAVDQEKANGKEKTTDKNNVTGPEYVTDKLIVTGKENMTDKENATSNNKATDKDNVTAKDIATGSQNVTNMENATVIGTATKNKKNGRDEHQLTILEKAMRLYELENPGIWSSDEDEAEKASRTYVNNSSQTVETDEYPNMPSVNA